MLKEDTPIGVWNKRGAQPIVVLPKGLTVKDVSDYNQMGQFEPRRFSITITTDHELVDYSADPANPHNDFYTADGWK